MSKFTDLFTFGATTTPAPGAPITPPNATNIPQPPGPAIASPPGNIPDQLVDATASGPTAAPNGVLPSGGGNKDDSPLAEFSTLWDTKPIDPNAPQHTGPAPLSIADVQKVVDSASFVEGVTPETLAAITAGGEGAAEAFMAALNSTAKNVMTQSTMVGNKLAQEAVSQALKQRDAELPGLMREARVTDHLNTSNPLFSNPAVLPVIEAAKSQLLEKFPNDTQAQTAEKLENYISAMGAAFNPPPAPKPEGNNTVDWDLYMGEGQ